MKTITLPNGQEYLLGIKHGKTEPDPVVESYIRTYHPDVTIPTQRYTEVFLKEKDQLVASARTVCSLRDNFCRRTGRKVAASRLLRILKSEHGITDKNALRTIFLAVCPEYAQN